MNDPVGRTAAFLALVVTAGAPGLAPAAANDDAAHWAQVRDCASRPDSRARHACVDEVLRAAGALTPEAESREKRQRFGLERNAAPAPAPTPAPRPAPAPAPAAVATPASPAAPPPPPPAAEPATPEELQVTVAKVTVGGDRRLVITTTDGALWRQTESQEIVQPPRAGDTVVIHRGVLGSFTCELPKRVSWRCARTK